MAMQGYVGQYWIVISGLLPKNSEQFLSTAKTSGVHFAMKALAFRS